MKKHHKNGTNNSIKQNKYFREQKYKTKYNKYLFYIKKITVARDNGPQTHWTHPGVEIRSIQVGETGETLELMYTFRVPHNFP